MLYWDSRLNGKQKDWNHDGCIAEVFCSALIYSNFLVKSYFKNDNLTLLSSFSWT